MTSATSRSGRIQGAIVDRRIDGCECLGLALKPHQAIGANERAVKNWFDAKNAPSGEFLVALSRHSGEVFETFLLLAGRVEHVKAKKIADATTKLREILVLLDDVQST